MSGRDPQPGQDAAVVASSRFNARSAAVYERSMGRWSRRLAPLFLDFAGLREGEALLDVGCGTGSLAFVAAERAGAVTGADLADPYLAAARERNAAEGRNIRFERADACALPFADASFDRAVAQLVLQFIPDPAASVAEMRRVVRPGGGVAAAVWSSGGGAAVQRMFWDTAATVDPDGADGRARTFTRPMTGRGELARLWTRQGLQRVEESFLTIWMDFDDFADWWAPIEAGEGTLGKFVAGLPEARRRTLERHLRAAYESGEPDGPRSFAASAWVCRGVVPA